MRSFFRNPLIAFFSSLKLSASLMAVLAIASAKATFIETAVGRDGAYDQVYAATWFEVLLVLLMMSLTLLFFRRWPYKPRQWGSMVLHISVVVILIGAGMTRYLGYEGIMPIREGATVNYIYSDKSHLQVTLDGEAATFPVRLWKSDANDVWGKVTLHGQEYELGVTEYWPHFTEVYQEGPGGPAGFNYSVAGHDHGGGHMLLQGKTASIGGADARFLDGDFVGEVSGSPYGDIVLNIGEEPCTLPIEMESGAELNCNGYLIRIVEFHSNFRVGSAPSSTGPLINPMVRLAIAAPNGTRGERMLFALHPEFSMGHGGDEDPFANLEMSYRITRGLEFARGGPTGIQGRASFGMVETDPASQEEVDIPAGRAFPLREAATYRNTGGDVGFSPTKLMSSVVLVATHSENPNDRPAARVVLRDQEGNQAEAVCPERDRPKTVSLNGQLVELSYGPVVTYLDYAVRLDDFVLQTYPGSDNPATYESHVTLIDEERGIEGQKAHIYMNHPLTHRGSKHFQSSYDQDRGGTVLTVNHDPGKWPTYLGYFLISLGFLLVMTKDVFFPLNKPNQGIPTASALLIALAAGALASGDALAQEHAPGDGHDHSETSSFVTLSDSAREMAANLVVQDFRGRMKPLDTLAREMVMKVARRSKFEGRHPVDQYLSWSLNPAIWWDKPLISLARSSGLKDLLGVPEETKHVSAASLFNEQGRYRLAEMVQEAHRTPDRDRTKTQRKLITFDERFNMLYMSFEGQALSVYPVPNDPNNTWHEFKKLQGSMTPEQLTPFEAAFASLSQGIKSGNEVQIFDGLNRTKALQEQYGSAVIPSDLTIKAELFYNKSHLWSWMMIPLLVAFVVLMLVYLVNLFRGGSPRLSFRNPFYSIGVICYCSAFAGMILAYIARWIASERIPISNGHESLLFISLAVALAGLVFELKYRMAASASLGGLLTTVILGVSMLSTFDPAIGPLVPVLVSYWLNIHVTIITASYGFLGMSALIGVLIMLLLLTKGEGKENVRLAIKTLDDVNKHVLVTGLGLLTVGTLLGGVWANESWGRYWGWDPKETWSLITILVYAITLHFRWIESLRSIWLNSAASLGAIASVIMTYFGVNYFLSGLHSYGGGDAIPVPNWVFIGTGLAVALIAASGLVNLKKSWGLEAPPAGRA